jgi:hypothetical protein
LSVHKRSFHQGIRYKCQRVGCSFKPQKVLHNFFLLPKRPIKIRFQSRNIST